MSAFLTIYEAFSRFLGAQCKRCITPEAASQSVKKPRLACFSGCKKMKNIHFLFSSYKTMIFRKIIRRLNIRVIKKSCVWFKNCDNSLGIPSNKMPKELTMTALLLVISLVVISVVVIIIPPCGAALGRGKA